MRDLDLRRKLLSTLLREHEGDASTRIVQEMGIWSGTVRVDIAVINGELQGYELKSDRDTLARLPNQAVLYNQVFDRVSLVVGQKHIRTAEELIPVWWGILSATMTGCEVTLRRERDCLLNEGRNLKRLAGLLWKSELLAILDRRSALKGYKSKPIHVIQERLIDVTTEAELAKEVRDALKSRCDWLG